MIGEGNWEKKGEDFECLRGLEVVWYLGHVWEMSYEEQDLVGGFDSEYCFGVFAY